MKLSEKQLGTMFWRRLMYFLKVRHISFLSAANASGYTRIGMLASRRKRSLPALPKLIVLADIIGITLEELCDPRIKVTDVEIPEPEPLITSNERFFSEDTIEYFKLKCLGDTNVVLTGTRNPDKRVGSKLDALYESEKDEEKEEDIQ